jgi:hypothetical protein
MSLSYEKTLAKNNFYKYEVALGKKSIAKFKEELKKYPGDCNERRLTISIINGIERGIVALEAKIVKHM